jgi:hypothetical protein
VCIRHNLAGGRLIIRLDRGDGKDFSHEELPRERLEKERITYLSAEQRLNYLVNIDKDGRLRWYVGSLTTKKMSANDQVT